MGIAVLLFSIPPVSNIYSGIMRYFVYFVKPHLALGILISFALTILSIGTLYIITHKIFVSEKYNARLPSIVPGESFLISGIVVVLAYKIILILASVVGGGAVIFVSVFGTFAEWPGLILIGVGLYKAYKSLAPINP